MAVKFTIIYIFSPKLYMCLRTTAFSMVAIPVYLRHNISYKEGTSGRLDITVGPKQTMGKLVSYYLQYKFDQVLVLTSCNCAIEKEELFILSFFCHLGRKCDH